MRTPSLGCPGPHSRRNFLKIGGLTLAGLGAHGVVPWQLRAGDGVRTEDRSVIFIWLPGGPPHTETYDMKPDRNDPTAVGTPEMAAAICAKMAEIG